MFIFSNVATGLKELMSFGAQGRHTIILHLLLFAMALALVDHFTNIGPKKLYVPVLIFLMITAVGIYSDFTLQDKSPEIFATYWEDFAKCVEELNSYCYVRVPPGTPGWGLAWEP